jgi:hypothetical protein
VFAVVFHPGIISGKWFFDFRENFPLFPGNVFFISGKYVFYLREYFPTLPENAFIFPGKFPAISGKSVISGKTFPGKTLL